MSDPLTASVILDDGEHFNGTIYLNGVEVANIYDKSLYEALLVILKIKEKIDEV